MTCTCGMPTINGYAPIESDANSAIILLQKAMRAILFCAFVVVSLYSLLIALALLQVAFNIAFKDTMIFLIGKHAYAVNFPICTATKYIGNDCYTTLSTYCA